jgi:ribonuclease HI
MTGEQVTRYQALLGENPQVQVQAVRTLNPTTYLPEEEREPLHSCEEILDEVFSPWPDLVDTAIPNADLELFTEGSRSLQEGDYQTGYAVTTITQVVEHGRLSDHSSAQWAELYVLTRALPIADERTASIYTDSHYAFATLHVHGTIYKERGLLMSGGKEVKNSQQILQLLEAVWKP